MTRIAVISVDGHVKASRAAYRDYLDPSHRETYDAHVAHLEATGVPDAGNVRPEYGAESQWDSDHRLAAMESQGVVAEVLFNNGIPFQLNRLEDHGHASDRELTEAGRTAFNRWLADFCAEAPERRCGQALLSLGDVDRAVADVHWAKTHGLGGVSLPVPAGRMLFDPALDPIWAACCDLGLPVTQHGGVGPDPYTPAGFGAIMTIAIESAFFSNRSLWQLIVGGVFERFPALQAVFVETQLLLLGPVLTNLDARLRQGDDWMEFAKSMGRERPFTRLASEYFATNCHVGVSPFSATLHRVDELVGRDADGQPLPGFHIGVERTMFGVDYPHFETNFGNTRAEVAGILAHPSVSGDDGRRILFQNAADLFGFDPALLAPHVDRVGFDLDHAPVPSA